MSTVVHSCSEARTDQGSPTSSNTSNSSPAINSPSALFACLQHSGPYSHDGRNFTMVVPTYSHNGRIPIMAASHDVISRWSWHGERLTQPSSGTRVHCAEANQRATFDKHLYIPSVMANVTELTFGRCFKALMGASREWKRLQVAYLFRMIQGAHIHQQLIRVQPWSRSRHFDQHSANRHGRIQRLDVEKMCIDTSAATVIV